jgi:flagellar biosynthetic protein FliQ
MGPMTEGEILTLGQQALMATLMLAGPFLLSSLVIGLVVSIFQAVTSISEMTLTFVPKVIGTALVLLIMGPWMGDTMLRFTAALINSLPNYVK